jgi:phospholipid-binding lipoprotein MlaA
MLARLLFSTLALASLAACATSSKLASSAAGTGSTALPSAALPTAAVPKLSLRDLKPVKGDPFQAYNRVMYAFNDSIDRNALRPTAVAYVRVVPAPIRRGVSNFFRNFSSPRTIVNDLLQGKLKNGGGDTARFLVNSTVGLVGLFDPASRMGLERHEEDFGQTLGRWGVPAGPYLVLPVLGPSTLRDSIARVPDEYTSTRHYIKNGTARVSLAAADVIDLRAGLLDYDQVIRESFDPYAFVRNSWLQRRQYLVKDGNVESESDRDVDLEDETAGAEAK